MDSLVLKLVLTPALIGAASLAGRTGMAPTLGPRPTGLLAPSPLYGLVLAVFAHRLHGPRGAIAVLRGLVLGLFGFAGFSLALAALRGASWMPKRLRTSSAMGT